MLLYSLETHESALILIFFMYVLSDIVKKLNCDRVKLNIVICLTLNLIFTYLIFNLGFNGDYRD